MKLRLLKSESSGFTLLELVITVTLLAILALGIVPLTKNSIKRQKETQLREALREMRDAIDAFHRDASPGVIAGSSSGGEGEGGGTRGANFPPPDPRSKVYISDDKIFTVDNPDRYPPDLETLVKGVKVKSRTPDDKRGDLGTRATDLKLDTEGKTKIYLRKIPIDPMTGEADWELRSCYDDADATSWGRENVFDVRSKSKDEALNGEKYADW